MGDFKLLKIQAQNFKGFRELEVSLSLNTLSILGGKNGFGKSTLFDIVELVLTGKIKRYSTYLEQSDKRNKFNEFTKPLVFDPLLPEVSVEICIKTEGSTLWLKRCADVTQMGNPIDFSCFSKLLIRKDDSREYEICENSAGENLYSLFSQYNFLHYLDQEESTYFLKKNSKDRCRDLECLFNTSKFEKEIDRCKEMIRKLKELKDIYKNERETKNNERNLLLSNLEKLQEGEPVPYFKLFKKVVWWDAENPSFEDQPLWPIIEQGGELDKILYFLEHRADYYKYELSQRLRNAIPDKSMLNKVLQFIFHSHKEQEVKLCNYFQRIVRECSESGVLQIDFSLLETELVTRYLDQREIALLKQDSIAIKNLEKNTNSLQTKQLQLTADRAKLVQEVENGAWEPNDICPLCGKDYGSHEYLLKAIADQTDLLSKTLLTAVRLLNNAKTSFEQRFNSSVIRPLKEAVKKTGINDELLEILNNREVGEKVNFLKANLSFEELDLNDFAKFESEFIERLRKITQGYSKELSFELLKATVHSYPMLRSAQNITSELIEKKRRYLIAKCRESSDKKLKIIDLELKRTNQTLSTCENKIRKLHGLQTEIISQKDEYLLRVIVDTQILFYIYTGRILQDNYFGRGIFMKYTKNKNILFVSGHFQSDVDVLYNMSSGQLSAIVIAFTLALNKLYASVPFLAIDDPVQTMDDMNFWGLIETIRHEFGHSCILLSTHEPEKGGLLNYKAHKLNIPSSYIDMEEIGSRFRSVIAK